MANRSATTPRITPEMTQDMRDYRLWELERDVPVKTRTDFETEDAYREYLLNSYTALRQQEYEYTVRNETLKVYNLAMDGFAVLGKKDNELVWNGYAAYINQPGISAEEKERRRQQVADCAISRSADLASLCMNGGRYGVSPKRDLHCCAITATSVGAQICGEMGYDRDENIFQTVFREQRGHQSNIVSAREYCRTDSITAARADAYPGMTPAQIRQETRLPARKSLNELIASGEIGVGDALALPTGTSASNSTSGAHAMVVAEIIKDDNGKPVAYTLQANNSHCFVTIDVNSKSGWGVKPVLDRAETHTIIGSRIGQECEDLRSLPIEELEARVVAARSHTEQVIGDLQVTEQYNAEKGYDRGQARHYVQQHQAVMSNQQFLIDRALEEFDVVETDENSDVVIPAREEAASDRDGAPQVTESAPLEHDVNETANVSAEVTAKTYTPQERADVYQMFAQCNDISWQSLVEAYQQVDTPSSAADFLRGGWSGLGNQAGSLVFDGLGGQNGNMFDLSALMSGDKEAADDMFTPLLTALTENDDKGLNDSMKLALGLLTEFLGGAEKDPDNNVPSLSDFMTYLADNRDNAPENEQGRQALQTPTMSPFMLNMMRGRA